jgi:serine/threonine protein kinase/tetratricopeptide (TPR) repeat protein
MGDIETKTLRQASVRIPPGTMIAGKFRILDEIGRGGMGVVYEAEDVRLKRTVALKFLPADLTRNPEARDRFIQEAQAASALDHVNICTIHEIGETPDGEIFIAMARYKGESLKDKLERGPLAPVDVIAVAGQVAEGLAKAHGQGIVHRDIKPGNIFVTDDGTVKILDFGLAKLAGRPGLTAPGTTMGTAGYMSPEQVRGEEVDARSDVWSLAVVLYEMMTGELPFRGDNDRAVLHAILNEPPRPASGLRPGFPAGLETLIRGALVKDPAKRRPTAAPMAAALRDFKAAVASRVYPSAKRLSFPNLRRRMAVVSAAAVVTLVAVALAIWLLNRPSLAFESRDKLMVADVDNQTGDAVFDMALRTAIEADLQQSPYASIFDRPQINETLRLMRKDPATKIDEATGYDVCRFAAVRAFVLPRILSAGDAYELQAILIDPVKHRHVDRIRVTAKGREDVLLHAIDKLAGKLRSRLGESLSSIAKADQPVAHVTTSSWDALNSFALGQAKWRAGKFKEAASLMELALEKDPQFVEARSSLGLIQCQFLGQPEKGQANLRQALKDAEGQGLPQRDVLKLRAANKQFVDRDLTGALEEYGVIRELFPDFMPPWNNSGMILRSLGRYDEAVAMFEKAAELAPHNSIPLTNLWFLQLNFRKDIKATEAVARRMVALSPDMAFSRNALGYSLAVQGRYEEAEPELRKATEITPDDPYGLPNLGHVLYAMGRAAEAVPVYRRVYELSKQGRSSGSPPYDGLALVLALRESGQREEARKVAAECRAIVLKKSPGRPPDTGDTVVLGALAAAAGDLPEASADLRKGLAAGDADAYDLMILAELEAILGHKKEAIATLKKSLAAGYFDYFFPVVLPGFQSVRDDPEFRSLYHLGQ